MKILNFGSCNIDYVYSLDHIVNVGETQSAVKMDVFPGGKGLNQSIALSRAGAKVYHAGCIGADGEFLRDILNESGVDTSYMMSVDQKNGHAVIQVSAAGENSIFLYSGSNDMITREYASGVLEGFEKGDILLLQNEISNIEYIVEKAHEKGMRIVLNPSPFNEKIKRIDFNMLWCIVVNEIEAKQISGCDDPFDALEYFKDNYKDLKVMLTLGANGCVYKEKDIQIYQAAFDVDAVDTTAAGDTFTGYFVAEMSRRNDHKRILKTASAASAISVTRNGAAPSIPTLSEVQEILPSLSVKGAKISDRIIQTIERYVEHDPVCADIGTLSRKLGYSEVYTGKLVKELTGKTFSDLVQDRRCDMAAQLLLDTDMQIGEIIQKVGYSNETFFRRIFKKKYGVNPLKFRKTRKA